MNWFGKKPDKVEDEDQSTIIKMDNNLPLIKINESRRINFGTITRTNGNEFLLEFDNPISLPAENPMYQIHKITIFSNNGGKTFTQGELAKKSTENMRVLLNGKIFAADAYLLSNIGKLLHNGAPRGDESNNFVNFGLSRLCWTFTYNKNPKERSLNKVFDFKVSDLVNIQISSETNYPVVFCKISPDYYTKHGECLVDDSNGELPRDFSWKKYNSIENDFGTIKKIEDKRAWLEVIFSDKTKSQIGTKIPNRILLCKLPFSRTELWFSDFLELVKGDNRHHPVVNGNVKFLTTEIAKALAMVIHGTKLDGDDNSNWKKIGLITPNYWVQSSGNVEDIEYINLAKGSVVVGRTNISTSSAMHVLTYLGK